MRTICVSLELALSTLLGTAIGAIACALPHGVHEPALEGAVHGFVLFLLTVALLERNQNAGGRTCVLVAAATSFMVGFVVATNHCSEVEIAHCCWTGLVAASGAGLVHLLIRWYENRLE